MKRIGLIAAVALMAIPLGAANAAASSLPVRLRGFSCQRAVRPVARSVSITSVMRPVNGTKKMALRFELIRRTKAGTPWSSVSGGDLGSWVSPSNPTLGQRPGDVWILHKSVIDLAAPAAYRYKVSFRWTGAHGRTLATATRWSSTCNQPELRPDLAVQSITESPDQSQPNVDDYTVTIANNGATAASNFRVQFTLANGHSKSHQVAILKPHRSMRLVFFGPTCSDTAASTITVDPDGVVDDFNRANNAMTAVCSSSAGQP
jgi:hypothetical protein